MALSKSTRIIILLCIDTAFFLLELIVGYAVHSLALVADSFHMLNDVLSLCVGLWAVKVASQKCNSRYTYGWQRAETLGALVNGVFLVALCLSIFLEAIQRFVEPQEVSNPKLVLVVGCFGLASNILGLFLFHDHGHSHGGDGGHGHSHGHDDVLSNAEEGNGSAKYTPNVTDLVRDEAGRIEDILPENIVHHQSAPTFPANPKKDNQTRQEFTHRDEDVSTAADSTSPLSIRRSAESHSYRGHRRHQSGSRSRHLSSPESLNIHPATLRNDIIAAGRLEAIESAPATDSENEQSAEEDGNNDTSETSPLLNKPKCSKSYDGGYPKTKGKKRHDSWHAGHKHNKAASTEKKGGHSHGDLNMRGVFLHVMGDALGNIGVIGSALIIWLTKFTWRFYADPLISLIITCIILASAIPLCKAASRILLQAVPAGININDIKADISELPGIVSCHHLHVWQLNDTKMIASLHVQVGFDFKGEGSARYMALALAIRQCLHEYGIHSSTIQPEFCLDKDHDHVDGTDMDDVRSEDGQHNNESQPSSKKPSKPSSMKSNEHACLLECGNECGTGNQCCAPTTGEMDGVSNHSH